MEETLASCNPHYPLRRHTIVNKRSLTRYRQNIRGIQCRHAVLPDDRARFQAIRLARPVVGDVDAVVEDAATRSALLYEIVEFDERDCSIPI